MRLLMRPASGDAPGQGLRRYCSRSVGGCVRFGGCGGGALVPELRPSWSGVGKAAAARLAAEGVLLVGVGVDTATVVVLLVVAWPVLEGAPDLTDVVVCQAVVGEGCIGQAVEQLHAVRNIHDAEAGVAVEGRRSSSLRS